MSNSKKDSNIIIFHHKRDDRDMFDGRSYLERSRMELNEKGPITLYRERYTLAETRRYAEEGVADAQFSLGEYYYYGTGDASDMNIAIFWFAKAAAQGHVDAQYMLGHIFEFGECEKVDYKIAKAWYEMAAKQGHSGAQFHLASLYRMRNNGIENNSKLAFKWMLKAAEEGGAPPRPAPCPAVRRPVPPWPGRGAPDRSAAPLRRPGRRCAFHIVARRPSAAPAPAAPG